jgi:hypothetical protein
MGSREGSVCSRSSSEFSDHESHKIHKDHKIKESEDVKTPTNVTVKKPEMLIIKTDLDSKPKPDKRILTTNFAEIRRLKQGISKKLCNLVYQLCLFVKFLCQITYLLVME